MSRGGPPPASLPLRHFAVVPAAALLAGLAMLARGGDLAGFGFDARFALGLTHCLTLGVVAQAIFGVWTQMIPAHGGEALAGEGGLKASWAALTAGTILFIGLLWARSDGYWMGAAVAGAGALGELTVLAATHRRAPRRDWTSAHFTAAMAWVGVLAALGMALAWDRQRGVLFRDPDGALIAHVHAALVGFAATTVYGAGYRLLPWVGRRHLESPGEGVASFWLTQAGLAGLVVDALFFGRRLMPLWAGLLSGGFLLYALALRPPFSPRPPVDAAAATALLSFAGGAAWCAVGAGLSLGAFAEVAAARAAYVFAALGGCLLPLILSQLRRVGPVIAWSGIARAAGADAAPPLELMSSPGSARVELAGCALALLAGPAGLLRENPALIRLAGAGVAAAAAACGWNLFLAVRALRRASIRTSGSGNLVASSQQSRFVDRRVP